MPLLHVIMLLFCKFITFFVQYQSWKFSPKDESVLKAMNVLSIYHVKNNRRKLSVSSMGQATKASLEVRLESSVSDSLIITNNESWDS